MTNRHVTFVQLLYRDILSDISGELPTLRKELDRDFSRLCSAIEHHGLRFATIDLVDAGKHFDKCLSASRLTPFLVTHMRPYKRDSVIPRLFRGLLRRVFDDSGCLAPTCDHKSVRALRQLYYAVKKLKLECGDERTRKSVRDFFHVDSLVEAPTLIWGDDNFDPSAVHPLSFIDSGDADLDPSDSLPRRRRGTPLRAPIGLLKDLQYVSDIVASSYGLFNPYDWVAKHGPGAVSDGKDASKFEFPTWPKKLESVFPLADFAYANFSLWADALRTDEVTGRFSEMEAPSKLISVPKTMKAPRLIASEPTSHQWCQQIIKDFLYTNLAKTPLKDTIHFRDQTFNQRAARQASIDGRHWTIDLSEASDRVSCHTIERMFRRNISLLDAFRAVRTRFISNKICRKQPPLYELRKFSTMGSALTFPIQSICFSNIVIACLMYSRSEKRSRRTVSKLAREVLVFGDDLIVPEDVGQLALGLLRYLGFKVNQSKTFGNGRFRESCGGEYFQGHNVTPTYALTIPDRRRPESILSSVDVHNNFVRNGYAVTARRLKQTVLQESKILIPVAPVGSGLLCWESYAGWDLDGLRRRRNKDLHVTEARVHRLVNRGTKLPDRGTSRVLQYFTEAPPPTVKWEGGVRGRPKLSLKLGWVRLDLATV